MNAPEGADTAAPPFLERGVCGRGPRRPQRVEKDAEKGPRWLREGPKRPESGPQQNPTVSKTADETEKGYGEAERSCPT